MQYYARIFIRGTPDFDSGCSLVISTHAPLQGFFFSMRNPGPVASGLQSTLAPIDIINIIVMIMIAIHVYMIRFIYLTCLKCRIGEKIR